MKEAKIHIEIKTGSKFQEQFARDSLLGMLKAYRQYINSAHKKNEVSITINGSNIKHLDFFNWIKQ